MRIERHRELGARLKAIRSELRLIASAVRDAYPDASRPARAASKAQKALDALRVELDNACATEHEDDFKPTIYYG